MDIVVCIKRVPDVAEADIAVDATGKRIDDADLTWGLNEWDAFAVEEALRLRDAGEGSVTVLTVGDEDGEDVLRRALAMGADRAVHLIDDAFEGSDPYATASILAAAIRKQPFDLVLAGAVSGDTASAQVGGMLAAMLDIPQVAKAGAVEVQHEVEGGLERIVELDLPALVTIQTGINEPRYVSIRGIRKVAGVEIPTQGAADLGVESAELGEAGSRLQLLSLSLPASGEGAEILEGSLDERLDVLIERLRERGGI